MKKSVLFIMLLVLGVVMGVTPVFAQTSQDFTIQATVPDSNAATFNVSRVFPGPPEVFQPLSTTTLDFLTLTLDTVNGIYTPEFFWVVDIGSNGVGMPDMQFSYTDTANPNGAINDGTGLGGRGTIAYSEVVTNPDTTQTVNLIRGESLAESNTSGGIDEILFLNGFLRVSVGIATGDPLLQEGVAVPFTALDAAGLYSGVLTMTATFD